MGLGRATRFAPLPPGARRVSVMRAGRTGLRALAPSAALLADFVRAKRARIAAGAAPEAAHAEACRAIDYRERFRTEIRSSPEALRTLREVVAEARNRDLYLMCMCSWRTPEEACHTYLLLDLARELEPTLPLLPEPAPRPRAPAAGSRRAGGPARARYSRPHD